MANKLTIELGVIDRMSNAFRKVESGIQRFVNKTSNMFKQLLSLPNIIAGAAIVGIGKKFIDAAGKIEVFQKQLEMVTGSAGKASQALGAIRDFARTSPLETEDVVQSYVRLRAVGIDPTMKQMRTLGGVAVLMNMKMGDMLNSFIGYNKRTLRSLGIEIDRTGKQAVLQSGGIKKVVDKDSASIRQALLEIWEQRFPNAIETASNTFSAKMAIMRSEIFETVLVPLGEKVLPMIKDGLDDFTKSVNGSASKFQVFGNAILKIIRVVDLGIRGTILGVKAAILIPIEVLSSAMSTVHQKIVGMFYSLIKSVNDMGVDMMMSQNAIVRGAGKSISDMTMPLFENITKMSQDASAGVDSHKTRMHDLRSSLESDVNKMVDVWTKYEIAINKAIVPASGDLKGTGYLGGGGEYDEGGSAGVEKEKASHGPALFLGSMDDWQAHLDGLYGRVNISYSEWSEKFYGFNTRLTKSLGLVWQEFTDSLWGRFKSTWDTITDLHSTAQEKIQTIAEQGYRMMTDMLFEYIKSFVQAKLTQLAVSKTVSTSEQAANYQTAASEGVSTAMSAGKSVAKIPYVGAALAVAAIGTIMALLATSISKAKSYAVGTVDHPGGLAKVHKDEYVDLPAHARVYTRGESRAIDAQSGQSQGVTNNFTIMASSMAIVEELRRVIRTGAGDRLIADLKYAGI